MMNTDLGEVLLFAVLPGLVLIATIGATVKFRIPYESILRPFAIGTLAGFTVIAYERFVEFS
jgi:hypothetical protein